jgi:hypothetical protein
LFPVVKSFDDYYNLHIEDFYILEDDHEIKACAAIWNVSDYKQFTVINYKGPMKLARIFNPVLSLLKYVKLPKENEPLNFPMLSFFLSKDDNEDCYKILFHRIKNEIKKNHEMFLVGLPHNHVIASVMKNLPKVTFESTIYEVRFSGQKDENISFDSENIYTESALL